MRKSKACQMKRTRRVEGVEGWRTRRERTKALFRRRRTERRETIVVVSSWSMIVEDILGGMEGAGRDC